MTAYAEGYEVLAAEDLIKDPQAVYQAWTNGTVVRSWLQQLLAKALKEDPELDGDHRIHRGLRRRPVDGRGGDPAAGARPGDRGGAVRPVPVPPGRLADHEGGGGAAQPVRRPRGQADQRVRIAGCTSATWDCRTSGHGRRSTWTSSRAAPYSSPRTATVRPISLRHCGIRRHWDPPGRLGRAAAAGGRRAGDHLDDRGERRPRARRRPGGLGGTRQQGAAEPLPRPVGARGARRAARGDVRARRTWRWCAGIPPSGGGTSTSSRPRGGPGSPACAPTTTRCCGSGPRCSRPLRRRATAATAAWPTPSTCGTATWPHTGRS